jgi:hypothetical protein
LSRRIVPAAALLLTVLSLAAVRGHTRRDALSADEPIHILAGYLEVFRRTAIVNIEHPPLMKALAGLGLNSYRLRAKQWHPETEDVVRAMKVILTPEYQPVFVHCQAGKDRTGLVVAVYRILVDGWSVEDAIAERKMFGAADFWEDSKTYLRRLESPEARRKLMAAIEAAPVPPVARVP